MTPPLKQDNSSTIGTDRIRFYVVIYVRTGQLWLWGMTRRNVGASVKNLVSSILLHRQSLVVSVALVNLTCLYDEWTKLTGFFLNEKEVAIIRGIKG